jgi:hypothetical protein
MLCTCWKVGLVVLVKFWMWWSGIAVRNSRRDFLINAPKKQWGRGYCEANTGVFCCLLASTSLRGLSTGQHFTSRAVCATSAHTWWRELASSAEYAGITKALSVSDSSCVTADALLWRICRVNFVLVLEYCIRV